MTTTPHQIACSVRSLVTSRDPEDRANVRQMWREWTAYLRETADGPGSVSTAGEHYSWQLVRERAIQCLAFGMATRMLDPDPDEREAARRDWRDTDWQAEWEAACPKDRKAVPS